MRKLLLGCFLALSCILPGCASGPLTPKPIPLGEHDYTYLRTRDPVSVINKQVNKFEDIEYRQVDNTVYYEKADLDAWCDQSIILMKDWLKHNNIPITDNADKKIFVSIANPKDRRGGSVTLDINIETGDGLVKTFSSEATAAGTRRAIGYAINWGVVKVIHDPDVLYYLEQEMKSAHQDR